MSLLKGLGHKDIRLYLAHPVLLRREIRNWELVIESRYDVDFINPFYDSHTTTENRAINTLDDKKNYEYSKRDAYNIVRTDLHSIQQADGIVAFLDDTPSIGTIMEICYNHQFHKPTFVVAPDFAIMKDGYKHPIGNHPWVQYHATRVFKKEVDFEDFIARGGLKRAIHKARR